MYYNKVLRRAELFKRLSPEFLKNLYGNSLDSFIQLKREVLKIKKQLRKLEFYQLKPVKHNRN